MRHMITDTEKMVDIHAVKIIGVYWLEIRYYQIRYNDQFHAPLSATADSVQRPYLMLRLWFVSRILIDLPVSQIYTATQDQGRIENFANSICNVVDI